MLGQLLAAVGRLIESVRSAVGVRVGIREPLHTVEPLIDGVEIRRYGVRLAAETTVLGHEVRARQEGFLRLIGYILGADRQAQEALMIPPMAQSGDRDQGWLIRLYLSDASTMDALPDPLDSRVRLVELPAETVAVLRFTGDRGPGAIVAQAARLQEALHATGFKPTGTPIAWFYDPPWTIPFLRRNEIAIPVCEYLSR